MSAGIASVVFMATGFAFGSWEGLRHGWGNAAFIATLGCGIIWFISSAAVFPCVRMRPDTLVVDNFVFRYVIPWGLVRRIDVSDGFEVVVAGWREPVGALAFSGSVIGAVTGYRTNNRVARKIETYRQEHADRSGGEEARRRLHLHPVSFVVWWVLLGVVVPLLKVYG